jgi:UDP-2,3-diacylglucosamine pyrophosphatase LpxH
MHYKRIIFSDLHLGMSYVGCEALRQFLKYNEADEIIMNGDIIDFWVMNRKVVWKQEYNNLVRKLLSHSKKGRKLVYVLGNHDSCLLPYVGEYGNVTVCTEYVYESHGKGVLVIHGDVVDGIISYAKWLALIGAWAYDFAIEVNHVLNRIRSWMGLPYWSLSKRLKQKVKGAGDFIEKFEDAIVEYARHKHCDIVICGHIHQHKDRMVGKIRYLNDGDLCEDRTVLVEHFDGRFEIVTLIDPSHTTM